MPLKMLLESLTIPLSNPFENDTSVEEIYKSSTGLRGYISNKVAGFDSP